MFRYSVYRIARLLRNAVARRILDSHHFLSKRIHIESRCPQKCERRRCVEEDACAALTLSLTNIWPSPLLLLLLLDKRQRNVVGRRRELSCVQHDALDSVANFRAFRAFTGIEVRRDLSTSTGNNVARAALLFSPSCRSAVNSHVSPSLHLPPPRPSLILHALRA